MSDSHLNLVYGPQHRNWVRLRTLVWLRWIAISGQIAALLAAQFVFELRLPYLICYAAIAVSGFINIFALLLFPENKRLSETQNAVLLVFDLLQLVLLLFLTGGLSNPFSLLILGPVTVSASVMKLRTTLLVGSVAIVSVTLMISFHYPLLHLNGNVFALPDLILFGSWAAIVIAILFMGAYSYRVSTEIQSMSQALVATQMALSREQKLTDLGGIVAATAHELGTPLATIKLASAELIDDLQDQPALREDAQLIRSQADRCRDILRSMGRAGNDDLHMRHAPIKALIDEAAEPHLDRGKHIAISAVGSGEDHPSVFRKPEIIHGLRNLIQNAVDFSNQTVWIDVRWSQNAIWVKICDDGAGFPPHLIGRLGDPFMRHRKETADLRERPEYEGMGLGLFIAKTLLERSGARVTFANGVDNQDTLDLSQHQSGAVVLVSWPRKKIDAKYGKTSAPTGLNVPLKI